MVLNVINCRTYLRERIHYPFALHRKWCRQKNKWMQRKKSSWRKRESKNWNGTSSATSLPIVRLVWCQTTLLIQLPPCNQAILFVSASASLNGIAEDGFLRRRFSRRLRLQICSKRTFWIEVSLVLSATLQELHGCFSSKSFWNSQCGRFLSTRACRCNYHVSWMNVRTKVRTHRSFNNYQLAWKNLQTVKLDVSYLNSPSRRFESHTTSSVWAWWANYHHCSTHLLHLVEQGPSFRIATSFLFFTCCKNSKRQTSMVDWDVLYGTDVIGVVVVVSPDRKIDARITSRERGISEWATGVNVITSSTVTNSNYHRSWMRSYNSMNLPHWWTF